MSRATLWAILPVALLAIGSVPAARAELVNLTTCNVSSFPACESLTSPYGTVTKSLSGTTATVTLTLNEDLQLINRGFAFNSTLDLTASNIGTISESLWSAPGVEVACASCTFTIGPTRFDGYGFFDYSITPGTGTNGNNGNVQDISFTVTGVSSLSDLDVSNGISQFAAEVGLKTCSGNGCTGYIGNGIPVVPDGGTTVLLLGFALGGMGLVSRLGPVSRLIK
jgi:hypothetical protein